MQEKIKKILEKSGELMIKVSDGQTFELHLHNTTFEDDNIIVVDTGTEKYWIVADEVVYFWIHKKKD